MKTRLSFLIVAVLACLPALSPRLAVAAAFGTAFTYQGRLNDGADPANGGYDLKFTLYDAPNGGNLVGTPLTNNAVAVGDGLFTVVLNFGPGIFTGEGRWMEIGVCTNGAGAFTALTPRQPLRATPYSLFALNAGTAATATNATTATTASSVAAGSVGNAGLGAGAVTADKVAAGQMVKSLNGLKDDISLAAGANIALATNGSQLQISSTAGASGGWALGGNAGTTPGTDFLGTSDNQPLEFKVNSLRALRIEPNSLGAPNLVGGAPINYVASGTKGATLSGGGATNYSGQRYTNSIGIASDFSTVGGGLQNTVSSDTLAGTVAGGAFNTLGPDADYSALGGGFLNTVPGQFATVPGGRQNSAANYAFAAGRRAKANHTGAFVWADSSDADFASTTNNQFLVRAGGGVGIGTNNPQSALHVAGTVTANAFSGSGAGLTGISGAALADGSVTSAKIAEGAVGSAQLASNAVTAANIVNGSITSNQLADGAVGSAQLASNLTMNGTLTADTFQGKGAVPWQAVTNTSSQAEPNKGYLVTNGSQVTITLPASPNVGDVVRVSAAGAGGWRIAQNASQAIRLGHLSPVLSRGVTWTARESNRHWSAVASSADGSKLVAVERGGQIYTSADSGVSWTLRPAGPHGDGDYWSSVASSADGSKLVAVVDGGKVYTSANSGTNWTPQTMPDLNWQSVASSADGTKLVAAIPTGRIYTSTDSGATWTPRENNRSWRSVASSADGSKLVAVDGAGFIYTSMDSGATWTARENSRWWGAVASSADGSKLVAVEHGYSGGGRIYTSTDSGAHWTARESYREWQAVASSADGSKLVAVVDNGQIYTSTDSGATWTARENSRWWGAVASSADGSKLVAVVDNGQIYTSQTTAVTLSSTTTPGPSGYLEGEDGTAIELQYIGNNLFLPLSHEGPLFGY